MAWSQLNQVPPEARQYKHIVKMLNDRKMLKNINKHQKRKFEKLLVPFLKLIVAKANDIT